MLHSVGFGKLDRYRDLGLAGCDRDRACGAALRSVVRAQSRDTQRYLAGARRCVSQRDPVVDHGTGIAQFAPDPLSTHAQRATRREPHVADDAAIRPPVVPGLGLAARPEARDRGRAGPIVDCNGQEIDRAQMRSDVEGVRGETTFVLSDLDPVQPDASRVEGGAKVQLHLARFRSGGQFKSPEIPGGAEIGVMLADVPAVGHADRFRSGWRTR